MPLVDLWLLLITFDYIYSQRNLRLHITIEVFQGKCHEDIKLWYEHNHYIILLSCRRLRLLMKRNPSVLLVLAVSKLTTKISIKLSLYVQNFIHTANHVSTIIFSRRIKLKMAKEPVPNVNTRFKQMLYLLTLSSMMSIDNVLSQTIKKQYKLKILRNPLLKNS